MQPRRLPHNDVLDPIHLSDLRRRRDERAADVIVRRAAFLLPPDKALLLAVYRDGASAADLARLHRQDPRNLRRRIRALVQRVLGPRFVYVLRHRDRWTPTRAKVATACAVHGMTLREASSHLRVSLHTVRKHMDAVRLDADTQPAADILNDAA